MKVIKVESKTVKTYTVHIEDGEVREVPYSGSGRRYRVERVVAQRTNGGMYGMVKLYGHVLKKDGSMGATSSSETLYGERMWPEWLRPVIGGLA